MHVSQNTDFYQNFCAYYSNYKTFFRKSQRFHPVFSQTIAIFFALSTIFSGKVCANYIPKVCVYVPQNTEFAQNTISPFETFIQNAAFRTFL